MVIAACVAQAQSPRIVFKSIAEGDKPKAVERLEKISLKTRNEMPEMCVLADAAVMCMEGQSLDDMVRGYEMMVSYIEAIRSSEHLDKVFKGNDISLDAVVALIENNSYAAVVAHNREQQYRDYLALAQRGSHSQLSDIQERVMTSAFEGVIKQRSVEACDKFTAEFPDSKFSEQVAKHRADLLFDQVMKSTLEGDMEQFIVDNPNYPRLSEVQTRLMESRYKRVSRSENIEQMRWFVDLYPDYREISRLKQVMANIEYPMLEDSCEALEAFVAYYPAVRQVGDAKSRINLFKIIERGDIGEILRYIKQHGYEPSYTRMQRAIANKHGYILLTDDIRTVSLIRFCDAEGKIGYMSHDGRVVVSPKYEQRGYVGIGIPSDVGGSVFECLTSRGLAVVVKDGKFGAINGRGEEVIATTYQDVAFLNGEVACVVESRSGSGSEWQNTTYVCTTYDYKGSKLADGKLFTTGSGVADYNNWDISWFSTNVNIKDTLNDWEKSIYVNGKFIGTAYGGFHSLTSNYRWFQAKDDEKINVIARNGSVVTLNFRSYDIEIIYDNIIMAESISSGNRCVIDLDKQSIISKDKFREMYPMSDEGLILVQYLDNHFGYVNRSFSAVITERYDRAYSFNCGTAAVIKGGVGYLIDVSGKQVSDNYDDIAPLAGHRGLYKVSKDGKCGIIDANDDVVVAIEHQPLRSNHYSSDRLSAVQSVAGVIEWANGVKTPIFETRNQ
jgi:hypothetical protein